MTENEAIKILEERYLTMSMCGSIEECKRNNQSISAAITALNEIQQYRAIGTVEECREAREKQKPKIADVWGDGYDDDGNMIYDMYDCPNCGETYEIGYQDYKYCPECGQAIDWS